MTGKKKIKWGINDVFAIPLIKGESIVGQILDLQMSNIVRIAIYDEKILTINHVILENLCQENDLISLVACSREQLDYDIWKIIGRKEHFIPVSKFPNEQYRNRRWVGAIHYDAAVVEDFVNAFYSLIPWDDWGDPFFLDTLLLDKTKKPKKLLFIKS